MKMEPLRRMRRWVDIGPRRRRTPLEQVVKAARDAELPASLGSALGDVHVPKRVKTGVTAVVATTAASAGISALRRRIETPRAGQ
jgi:hypothetical protein